MCSKLIWTKYNTLHCKKTCNIVNSSHTIHVHRGRFLKRKPTKFSQWFIFFPWNRNVYVFLISFFPTQKVNFKDRVNQCFTQITLEILTDMGVRFLLLLRAFNYTICWLHGHWVSGMGSIVSSPTLAVFASAEWGLGLAQNCESQSFKSLKLGEATSLNNSIQRQQYLVSFNEVKISENKNPFFWFTEFWEAMHTQLKFLSLYLVCLLTVSCQPGKKMDL